MLHQRIFSTNY